MATIQEIIQHPDFNTLHLVAGNNGVYRKIGGINLIENIDLTMFCHPNELIVTTGLQIQHDSKKLEDLVKSSYAKRVAGFVINTGPYIPYIPESIIEFGNEHNFPIFQMNWKHRVTDLFKITFHFLSAYQEQQSTDTLLLSNLLFRYKQVEDSIQEEMQQNGFPKGAELAVITCSTTTPEIKIDLVKETIVIAFKDRYKHFLYMTYKNQILFLINRSDVKKQDVPFSKTVDSIYKKTSKNVNTPYINIGMGGFYTGLQNVSKSYNDSLAVIHLAKQHNNRSIYKYKDIGAYKIIMSVQDQSIIETFRKDMLGRLYRYDKLHNTDLIDFLRIYLDKNGSTSKISQHQFIHRNTVLYKIKKIESILDIDLNNTFSKTNLSIAFMIEDVLNQR